METLIERMNRRGISTSSIQTGVYKVHGEVPAGTMRQFPVHVSFLDETIQRFLLDKKAKGSDLLSLVFQHLELIEREYFGLVFCEGGAPLPSGASPDTTRWLDPTKLVRKQMRVKGLGPVNLQFRVKFYVTDPSRIQEEYTRYHIYLQVKQDLSSGRLLSPLSTACLLTSYAAQSTLGDYDTDSCRTGYLAPFANLRSQCKGGGEDHIEVERRIAELHRLHKGQSPAEAELNFLEHAKRLEMFGISLHPGKDSNGRDIQLGVTSIGLVVFQNNLKINTFSWSKIVKISFKRKQFFIQLRKELTESYDTLLGFNLSSYRSCKNLWKSAVEHHSFFRLQSPRISNKRFPFTLSSKFRYSGRTEYQTVNETTSRTNTAGTGFLGGCSSSARRGLRQTLPVNLERRKNILASPEHSSIGSSNHHANSTRSNGSLPPTSSANPLVTPSPSHPGKAPSEASSRVSLAVRAYESFNTRVQSLGVRVPRRAWTEESDDDGGFLARTIPRLRHAPSAPPSSCSGSGVGPALRSNRSPPVDLSCPPAKFSFVDDSSSEKGSERASSEPPPSSQGTVTTPPIVVTSSSSPPPPATSSVHVTPSLTVDQTPPSSEPGAADDGVGTTGGSGCEETASQVSSSAGSSGLVIITMLPDSQGRFGFNVKGGSDQGVPVIVSRVAGGTPADTCIPRLSEGDQVVMINGRDISALSHDQVVNFIRAAREPHSGQLILAVRQNVYLGEEVEEPVFQYVPEKCLSPAWGEGEKGLSELTPLQQSMLLLAESLESGAISGQFEQLYRRNPSIAITECHLPANAAKNRYKDISPYDSTRVVLKACPAGDYINANHVVMEIPGSGLVNRYIATQGPLSHTCVEYWYMVWEQDSPLLIMLTTVVERGRVKCHKYWPHLDSTVMYGSISVTCTREEIRDSFAYRDFTIFHADLPEDGRVVTQMQYLSWPDHGTPDDSTEFVEFVDEVRETRLKAATAAAAKTEGGETSAPPTLVHCSAGIGRTGVLILMETALCLIEADQPVYPLDLTRCMRDQRPAMIQTPSQYRFVCEAITSVYKSGRVKPIQETT